MAINNSVLAIAAPELSITMNGSFQQLQVNGVPSAFIEAPVIVIFDNQSTTSTGAVSFDGGTTTWKTFTAGEALVLDMRANHGQAANFTFPKGTAVYVNGTAGNFSVSYVYAQNQ
jgi:hypothetical protein